MLNCVYNLCSLDWKLYTRPVEYIRYRFLLCFERSISFYIPIVDFNSQARWRFLSFKHARLRGTHKKVPRIMACRGKLDLKERRIKFSLITYCCQEFALKMVSLFKKLNFPLQSCVSISFGSTFRLLTVKVIRSRLYPTGSNNSAVYSFYLMHIVLLA